VLAEVPLEVGEQDRAPGGIGRRFDSEVERQRDAAPAGEAAGYRRRLDRFPGLLPLAAVGVGREPGKELGDLAVAVEDGAA